MRIDEIRSIVDIETAKSVTKNMITVLDGEFVNDGFKPKDKDLSLGCQSCKTGGWICMFISYKCQNQCKFCPQPRPHNDDPPAWPPFEYEPRFERMQLLKRKDLVTGISFSGGEPLLRLEHGEGMPGNYDQPGIYDWLDFINKEFDTKPYLWIYTNGKLLTEDIAKKLADKGIDEIRIDLAASNYQDYKALEISKKHINKVAVEVPVFSKQYNLLLNSLKTMEDIGVDYLNLHELMINPHNAYYLIGGGYVDPKLMYHMTSNEFDENSFSLPSLIQIYQLIHYMDVNNINIIYNSCTSLNKLRQVLSHDYLRISQESNIGTWEEYYNRRKQW